jgi:hypothetical protein
MTGEELIDPIGPRIQSVVLEDGPGEVPTPVLWKSCWMVAQTGGAADCAEDAKTEVCTVVTSPLAEKKGRRLKMRIEKSEALRIPEDPIFLPDLITETPHL